MSVPTLTVVMSCYNQATTLRDAVESFLMQRTDFSTRLIITDDCSIRDNSRQIAAEYANRHPDKITVLLNDQNGRYLKNVLRAMETVRSEYFTLLDADDYWTDPDYLNDAVSFLERNRRHTVYFRNVQWRARDGASGCQQPPSAHDCDMTFADFVGGKGMFPQTTGAVFRNVIFRFGIPAVMTEAVGTIHERAYDGDVFRFLQHMERGRAHFCNKVSGVYRISRAGVFSSMGKVKLNLIQAQCFVDYEAYFGKGTAFFVNQAWRSLLTAVDDLPGDVASGCGLDEESSQCLASVVAFLSRNRDVRECRGVLKKLLLRWSL